MAFVFERGDRSVRDGFRRIATEQMDRAMGEADGAAHETAEAIHAVRKRAKRLRGLLRLVRYSFPDYARENAAVRDMAAGLSSLRDADVLGATFDKVSDRLQGRLDPHAVKRMRGALRERGRRMKAGADEVAALAAFRAAMAELRARAERWRLDADGFDGLANGLGEVYRRARRDLKLVRTDASGENFHDWRKQVKYHWHHLCLLRACAPHILTSQRDLANELAETLGDHHDIDVLLQLLADDPEFSGLDGARELRVALQDRQDELGARALELGYELTAERTDCLVQRLESYWTGWQRLEEAPGGPRDRAEIRGAA